jgi:hypothetical protein
MAYFGYLRRDPDDSGYEFWLSVLNQPNGRVIDIVQAFIVSAEYRQRFGPLSAVEPAISLPQALTNK